LAVPAESSPCSRNKQRFPHRPLQSFAAGSGFTQHVGLHGEIASNADFMKIVGDKAATSATRLDEPTIAEAR